MRKLTVCLVFLACIAIACDSLPATHISKILDNPQDYNGKSVTVEGEVTEISSLLFMKYFVLDDGTGTMAVVTLMPLPEKGKKMRVKGVVNKVFPLGEIQTIVIVEDSGGK
jgi:hypothetical protein